MSERYRKPQTIDELKRFCAEKGMPLERMRFFIGEDYRGARAFGVYEAEDGDFVVYKNKENGERAVRYKGPNEAYAVNELYEKLKSETEQRRSASRSTAPDFVKRKKKLQRELNLVLGVAAAFIIGGAIINALKPDRGYYRYENQSYYYYDDWYAYDTARLAWYLVEDVSAELSENYVTTTSRSTTTPPTASATSRIRRSTTRTTTTPTATTMTGTTTITTAGTAMIRIGILTGNKEARHAPCF